MPPPFFLPCISVALYFTDMIDMDVEIPIDHSNQDGSRTL